MAEKKRFTKWLTVAGAGLAALLVGLGVVGPVDARDELTLRVNDADGVPGGRVAIVLRTYASRPLGQGQVCFRLGSAFAKVGAQDGPFAELEGFELFGRKDAQGEALLERRANGQELVLRFSSDQASVNRADGPIAVFYLRLRDDLQKGQTFPIEIDPENTVLFGASGELIKVRDRAGMLEIRGKGSSPNVEADGDTVRPGDNVRVGVETFEPFAIQSGQVVLRYDPSIVSRPPKVKMDRRLGKRRFRADVSQPGLVHVEFEARKGELNQVPGKLVEIRLRTSRLTPAGTVSDLEFDRSQTFFLNSDGEELPVKLTDKTLTFVSRSSDGDDEDSDTDGDSDADTDGDSDGDTDGDSDADTDGDSDADTDGDSDGDTDGDSDADTDGDSDADTDGDSDADTDGDSDADTDGDSDADTDGDSDGDTDDDSDSSDDDSG